MIRVMLVDDHALVRMAFCMLLADAPTWWWPNSTTGERTCADYAACNPTWW